MEKKDPLEVPPISGPLEKLAKKFNLIKPNDATPIPYILTEKEEIELIQNHIADLQKHYTWKLADRGASEATIQIKIDAINWHEEFNREEYLKESNERIFKSRESAKEEKERKEKEKAAHEEWQKQFTAEYFFRLMQRTSYEVYGKKLIVDDQTSPLIKTICFFFSGDPRFETELGYSFKKGLLIRGISGLGKTHLLKCIADNDMEKIGIHSMLDITREVQINGEFLIPYSFFCYLDDVGTEEPTIKHYGTMISFFKDFIELYYLNRPTSFNRLIISTNNSFDELEKKYGFRARSRMREMFNIIDVHGKDMRV